jgi:hypothetical protein
MHADTLSTDVTAFFRLTSAHPPIRGLIFTKERYQEMNTNRWKKLVGTIFLFEKLLLLLMLLQQHGQHLVDPWRFSF